MKATGRIIGNDSGKVGTDTRRIQPRRCDNGKPADFNPGGVITSKKAVKPAESTQGRPRTHHRNQKGSTEDQPQQSKGIRRRSISQPKGPEGLALLHSRLKERLLGQLGLFLVDPDKGFVLLTDASDYAVGAVLEEIRDDGSHVPVAFWSRILAEGHAAPGRRGRRRRTPLFVRSGSGLATLDCNR